MGLDSLFPIIAFQVIILLVNIVTQSDIDIRSCFPFSLRYYVFIQEGFQSLFVCMFSLRFKGFCYVFLAGQSVNNKKNMGTELMFTIPTP